VTAAAFSSFFSSSGNGGGAVLTAANASVTIQYQYLGAQQIIPEPSSVLLLSVGIAAIAVARQIRLVNQRKSRTQIRSIEP
jgi:hypothetical protein